MRANWEIKWFLFWIIDWICLFYLDTNKDGFGALGKPQASLTGGEYWDSVKVSNDYEKSGQYMLTDKYGKSLTWLDVENGMTVKIKAKSVNYPGYEYLQPTRAGNCLSRIPYW